MKNTNLPEFAESKIKFQTRLYLKDLYFKYSKYKCFPLDRQYWTLCNKQPNILTETYGSEICQLEKYGLNKKQFYGVDNNQEIIDFNKKEHPEANWFCGNFTDVIEDNFRTFNPAIVNFDSTQIIDTKKFIKDVAKIMNCCCNETLFVVTAMMESGRDIRKHNCEDFFNNLKVYNHSKWEIHKEAVTHKTSVTNMIDFYFWRR